MKRRVWFALVPLALAACEDAPTQTESERGPPLFEIVDAINNAGNQHFFFLPPLVPDPIVSGVFDGSLSPVVEICGGTATNPTTGRCQDPLTEFTTSTGLGSETLRVVPEAEHYIANWHTDEFHLDPAKTYRIRVLVSGTELGHADVKPVSGGSMKDAKTQDVIPLRDGRTLAIKFRIEEGAVFVVGSSGGTITAIGGDVTLVLPSGALTEDAGITVEPVSEPPADVGLIAGAVFEFEPDGTVFEQLVQLTIVYDESNLPAGVDEADLVLLTEENDVWDEVPGSTVDVNANTITGSISGFSKGGGGQKVASVVVTPTPATLFVGETVQLTATPKNSAGDPLNRAVTWSSSDDAVATVDANGLVTAGAPGSATISAKSGSVTGTAAVTVDGSVLQPSEFCSDHPNAAIATFEDANLEAAIRSALGVGAQEDLTCGLISGLTGLATLSAGIESLVGMQNLTSLTFLNLGGDPITDISALSELTSLTVLLLTANSISDISPLSGLTSLTRLSVEDNSVTDISALSRLTGLTQLFLRDNSITDIGVLSGLTSLTRLFLTANSVTDISALSGLTSLTDLSLENNSITDISEPLELPSLIFLRLGDNSITDISALSGFTSLTFLFLIRNSDLSNIQPLLDNEGLGAGDSVDLRSTNVSCVDVAALIAKEVKVSSNFSAAELANCSSP